MQRYALPTCFCLAIIFWNSGCGPAPKKPGETVAVNGSVNLDGKPMETGEIWFSVPGETPHTLTISKGTYSGKANPGKNKVEIYSYKEGPPLSTDPKGAPTKINTLPSQYHGVESTLTAEVTKSGPNDFKFEITSQ